MAESDMQGVGDDFKPQRAPVEPPEPLPEERNYDGNERADDRVRIEQPDGEEAPRA